MMSENQTPDFHQVVRLLRAIHPRYRMLALYAANFWDDDRLDESEANGDLPGLPGELKPKAATVLKLVSPLA